MKAEERTTVKLSIISFTENGKLFSENIIKILKADIEDTETEELKIEVDLFTKCKAFVNDAGNPPVVFVEQTVGDWARLQMEKRNAMLFIGACGIAVRAIAPVLTDKLQDAPVLVMDEKGNYVIPILSGHMGGANELAIYLAKKTGADPVITTATDINRKFAVDLFAKRNGLFITNKDGIVKVSSKVLAGKEITMSIEPGHSIIVEENNNEPACLPSSVRLVPYPPAGFVDVVVTSQEDVFDAAILLKPKEYVIGVGCKKGKKTEEIGNFITKKINELGICVAQIFALASISQKRDEPGMIAWCRKEGIPFLTYTAEELQEVQGTFTESSFVKEQMGVDNVCERAALRACREGGELIAPKYAENGMTIAVVKKDMS